MRAHAPGPDPGDVERAVALLANAKRPLVVAGRGAYWSHAGDAVRRLNREFGMPVLLAGSSRGLVSEDFETVFPWPIGSIAAREADVVILAGARMEGSIGFAAPPFFTDEAKFIQIASDAAEIGRNRAVDAPIAGDTRLALEAVAAALAARKVGARDASWAKTAVAPRLARIEVLGRSEEGEVHPLRMARELAKRMAPDALFVGDGANCNNWYKATFRVSASPGFIDHEPFGAMGVGLPHAIGAAAAFQEDASARQVYLGTGDGAFGQYLGEWRRRRCTGCRSS